MESVGKILGLLHPSQNGNAPALKDQSAGNHADDQPMDELYRSRLLRSNATYIGEMIDPFKIR